MLQITAWLRTQLDSDETDAHAVDVPKGAHWLPRTPDEARDPGRHRVVSGSEVMALATRLGARHIANVATPTQVLADIETKRQLIDLYEYYEPVNDNDPMHGLFAEIVYRLARAYAQRPGWEKRWSTLTPDPKLTIEGWWPPRLHPV